MVMESLQKCMEHLLKTFDELKEEKKCIYNKYKNHRAEIDKLNKEITQYLLNKHIFVEKNKKTIIVITTREIEEIYNENADIKQEMEDIKYRYLRLVGVPIQMVETEENKKRKIVLAIREIEDISEENGDMKQLIEDIKRQYFRAGGVPLVMVTKEIELLLKKLVELKEEVMILYHKSIADYETELDYEILQDLIYKHRKKMTKEIMINWLNPITGIRERDIEKLYNENKALKQEIIDIKRKLLRRKMLGISRNIILRVRSFDKKSNYCDCGLWTSHTRDFGRM